MCVFLWGNENLELPGLQFADVTLCCVTLDTGAEDLNQAEQLSYKWKGKS